jgi:hypothetical protein
MSTTTQQCRSNNKAVVQMDTKHPRTDRIEDVEEKGNRVVRAKSAL